MSLARNAARWAGFRDKAASLTQRRGGAVDQHVRFRADAGKSALPPA
ncbi:MAG: hypothetical protein QE284_09450 [Rhizobium sp.]|nr:hypothetical protein [Rhizobium sp.]